MDDTPEDLMLMLLEEGSTDHAIELYREEMDVERSEAVRVVSELSKRHGIQIRRPSLLPFLMLGGTLLFAALLAF